MSRFSTWLLLAVEREIGREIVQTRRHSAGTQTDAFPYRLSRACLMLQPPPRRTSSVARNPLSALPA
jgi:hypothetical protein